MTEESRIGTAGDRRPIPDPTELTTQQLYREIAALQAIIETRMEGYDKAIALLQQQADREPTTAQIQGAVDMVRVRLDATEKAAGLLQSYADRTPTTQMVQSAVEGLRAVVDERFGATKTQFEQRDVSVLSALAAAKEAVAEQNRSSAMAISKSEVSTQKQMDQQAVMIASITSALRDQIEDIKGRLIRMEQSREGAHDAKVDNRGMIGMLVGVLGLIIAAIAFFNNYGGNSKSTEPQFVYVPSAPATAAPGIGAP